MHLKFSLVIVFLALGAVSAAPSLSQKIAHEWRDSDVGIDYRKLRGMLAAQQWDAAAAETKHLIFQATAKTNQPPIGHDWLTAKGVETFPCRDLATLDRLWVEASQKRYGFTVQAQLWGKSFDSTTVTQDPDRWRRYRKNLGWQPRDDKDFQPDIEGRLPEPVKSTADFGDNAMSEDTVSLYGAAWLARVQQCGLYVPVASDE